MTAWPHHLLHTGLDEYVLTCSPGDYTTTKTVHSDTYPAIDPAKLPNPLTGRAVFIVGASRGIGKAVALSFARGGASHIAIGARADLAAVAEELKAAARAAGRDEPQVLCVHIEVSDSKSVAAAAARIDEAFGGRCDVVVQVAGLLGTPAKIVDADPEEWWRVYEVNVKGQFLLAKHLLPLMTKAGHRPDGLKTFVTVSSVGAHLTGQAMSQYQPTKLVNLRLAEFIDVEYRELGVSAFCVHPGNVITGKLGLFCGFALDDIHSLTRILDMVGGLDGKLIEPLRHGEWNYPTTALISFSTAKRRKKHNMHYSIWEGVPLLSHRNPLP